MDFSWLILFILSSEIVQRGKSLCGTQLLSSACGDRKFLVCKDIPSLVQHIWRSQLSCRHIRLSLASHPMPFPHFTLGGSSVILHLPHPQKRRFIQRNLEAIWQKEKEAIVSLQLESQNLFFLIHLHSHPLLPLATENWGIDALNLEDGNELHKISRAAGPKRNVNAPFFQN